MKTLIGVNLQIEGIHNWPGVVDTNYVDEVGYLQNLHRHIYHITCEIPVTHSDRDKEFIAFKHQILKYLRANYWSTAEQLHVFGSMSCEMLAKELMQKFDLSMCKVSEDGENYAIIVK